MKKNINCEVIDLAHTDDELLSALLEKLKLEISIFLDEEEKLGLLSQTKLDKIYDFEDWLQVLYFGRNKNNATPKNKKETLVTLPFDAGEDGDGDGANMKRKKQHEPTM